MLPAFQVQVLICTSDSGSNPEPAVYRSICWLEIIKKENRKIMKAVMALRNLSLGKTFVSYLVGRSFATVCFCMKHETFVLLKTWFIL